MDNRIGENEVTQGGRPSPSFGEVLHEVQSSTRDLIRSELDLIRAEIEVKSRDAGKHMAQTVAFGMLLAVSIFPFLAFLVIGLGRWMGGNYWLSSLIVAVVFAAVGGFFAYRAFKKLKENDLQLPHTQRSIRRETEVAQHSADEMKTAAKGERYDPSRLH